jgi:hypothetical protein
MSEVALYIAGSSEKLLRRDIISLCNDPATPGTIKLADIKLIDEEITGDAYRMVVGGPLYGGIDSVNINVGSWIRFSDFHLHCTILALNIVEALPRK